MATTRYVWDEVNDSYQLEKDGAGSTVAVYTNEPVQFGNLIAQRRNGVTSYFQPDIQGTTRLLTNSSQSITDTSLYTAFGETVASMGLTTNPFGYVGMVGYYTDSETARINARARVYQPVIIVWLSVDPIGHTDSKRYQYVSNLPTAFSDPSGMLEWSHKVEAEPTVDDTFGVTLKIEQTLTNTPNIPAAKGSQSWQTNEGREVELSVEGNECTLKKRTFRVLDVNDLGGRTTPISFTDTIGVTAAPDAKKSYCVFLQVVSKRLGLRPYVLEKGGVTFLEESLPTKSNYTPTDAEWERALKMQREPVLSAEMTYFFFDRKNCGCCTKEQVSAAGKITHSVVGGIDPSVYVIEFLRYSPLGGWFAAYGQG